MLWGPHQRGVDGRSLECGSANTGNEEGVGGSCAAAAAAAAAAVPVRSPLPHPLSRC